MLLQQRERGMMLVGVLALLSVVGVDGFAMPGTGSRSLFAPSSAQARAASRWSCPLSVSFPATPTLLQSCRGRRRLQDGCLTVQSPTAPRPGHPRPLCRHVDPVLLQRIVGDPSPTRPLTVGGDTIGSHSPQLPSSWRKVLPHELGSPQAPPSPEPRGRSVTCRYPVSSA